MAFENLCRIDVVCHATFVIVYNGTNLESYNEAASCSAVNTSESCKKRTINSSTTNSSSSFTISMITIPEQ